MSASGLTELATETAHVLAEPEVRAIARDELASVTAKAKCYGAIVLGVLLAGVGVYAYAIGAPTVDVLIGGVATPLIIAVREYC